MSQQKRRPANDRAFKAYKIDNRALKNKIKKVKLHIKKYPNDLKSIEFLKRLEKSDWKIRKASHSKRKNTSWGIKPEDKQKGINKGTYTTEPKPKLIISTPIFLTPGEQLSILLGIPLSKPRSRLKPKITHRKKR